MDVNEYEIEDGPCPHCGNQLLHVKQCDALNCDDGWIDEYEDDPINYAPGEDGYACTECHGTGWQRWCPSCGKDVRLMQSKSWLSQFAERLQTGLDELMESELGALIDECDHVHHGHAIHEIMLGPIVAFMAANLLQAREANRERED